MPTRRVLSPEPARRPAVSRQRLCVPRPAADAGGILSVVRDLGCLQIDLDMDRRRSRPNVHAMYAEPEPPPTEEARKRVAEAVEALAEFLGAEEIRDTRRIPTPWRDTLR